MVDFRHIVLDNDLGVPHNRQNYRLDNQRSIQMIEETIKERILSKLASLLDDTTQNS